ncbi:MAG TPA: type II secretion system protein GspM [Anaeromyxobacter sp.]|nr:type II secretion system protein GspM [Anaeromyxobacter sp.]
METLRRLRADLEAWLAKLAPRERLLVTVAALGVALFTVWLISLRVSSGMAAREERIETKVKVLSQVGKVAEVYRTRQAERQAIEAKLKGPPVQLLSYISQTGATLGVEVTDLRPTSSPGELEGLREDSVEVNLARIELARLTRLVQTLERGPGVVKVRRLRVTTRSDDPRLVDATVVVSTYQLKS